MARIARNGIRFHIREDRLNFLEAIATQVQGCFRANVLNTAWQGIRTLAVWGGKKMGSFGSLPMRNNEEGVAATSFSEIAEVVQGHFAKIEGATIVSPEALAAQHNAMAPTGLLLADLTLLKVERDDVMDFGTLVNQYKHSNTGKMPGPDGLIEDLARFAPTSVARHMLPLHVKATLAIREPLQWKAGLAVDLFKGKGDLRQMESYRSILLNNHFAKHHHKFLRGRLVAAAGATLEATQFGGLPGKGVDLASLLLSSTLSVIKRKSLTSLSLFIDVKAAYYSVLRQVLLPMPTSSADLDDLLESVEIPIALVPLVEHLLANPCLLASYTSAHLLAVLADVHQDTHFLVEGVGSVARTRKGTRPGDPLADMLFNIMLAPLLRSAQEVLVNKKVQVTLEKVEAPVYASPLDPSEATLGNVTLADDCVFPCVVPHGLAPEELPQLIAGITSDIAKLFSARGLALNFASGKCGMVVVTAGKFARRYRQVLFLERGAKIKIPDYGAELHLDNVYKHLGTKLTTALSSDCEVCARLAAHSKAIGPLRATVLNRKGLLVSSKLHIVESLATSVLVSNSGAWIPPKAGSLKKLDRAAYATYKRAMGLQWKPQGKHAAMANVFCEAGKLPPSDLIKFNRIRLLHRISTACPPASRLALDLSREIEGSWAHKCLLDIQWIQAHCGMALPDVLNCSPAMWANKASDLGNWTKLCRRMQEACLTTLNRERETGLWRKRLCSFARDAGLDVQGLMANVADQLVEDEPEFLFYTCGATFASSQGLHQHIRQAHNVPHPAKAYASGSWCQACGWQFHNRSRLTFHLSHRSNVCLAALMQHTTPMPNDELQIADAADKAEAKRLRSEGRRIYEAVLPAFFEKPPVLPPADEAAVQLATQRTDHPCVESMQLPRKQIRSALAPGTRYILHLFSGYRRHGDVQCHLEELLMAKHIGAMVLSVDIAIDAANNNLRIADNQLRWLQLILDCRVLAIIAGPPCETWSAARMTPLKDGRSPIALRSEAHLWGLPGLPLRLDEQVRVANALMQFSISAAFAAFITRTSYLMEHPSYPVWRAKEHPASCWLLPELAWLQRQEEVHLHTIDQGCFGAAFKKPTSLLAIHCAGLGVLLDNHPTRGRAHPQAFFPPMIGKDASGSWKTSAAKCYPPALCAFLAQAIIESLPVRFGPNALHTGDRLQLATSPHDSVVQKSYAPLDPYLAESSAVAPDFARP